MFKIRCVLLHMSVLFQSKTKFFALRPFSIAVALSTRTKRPILINSVKNQSRGHAKKVKYGSTSKGLIPRRRNSSREVLPAKYGWLHMN